MLLHNAGCPKINETHNVGNKYVNFIPVVGIFFQICGYVSDLIRVINNNNIS